MKESATEYEIFENTVICAMYEERDSMAGTEVDSRKSNT